MEESEPTLVDHDPGARLPYLLVGLDLAAAATAWDVAAWFTSNAGPNESVLLHMAAISVLALATVLVANARGLYRPEVCSLRAFEMQRVAQVTLVIGTAAALTGPALGLRLSTKEVVIGMLTSFVLTNTLRGGYRSWLSAARSKGRFQRRVVLVGANGEARGLLEHVSAQPHLGLSVVGVISEPAAADAVPLPVPHLGPTSDAEELVSASGADGVLIATTALSSEELNRVTRNLLRGGIHVHLSTGLQGFAAHRLRPQSIVNESILYIQPSSLARWQLGVKRGLDLVVGSAALVLSLPVMAVAAAAIKLEDGGPVIFRQTRVGRNGRHFTILKLRTMTTDAEARYEELAASLASRSGPLVKLHSDPRITRVGRLLRSTSLDELPQLFNVIGGSMSLVGPRPNLLVEAEGLDPMFLAQKCRVRPGLSGLWQVEARDNPSFDLYRCLDVFYVENWSISLDLAILLITVQRVLGRSGRLLRGGVPRHPLRMAAEAALPAKRDSSTDAA
ncbi:MAG: sugar transferase [Acidimicrobiales bacterium]